MEKNKEINNKTNKVETNKVETNKVQTNKVQTNNVVTKKNKEIEKHNLCSIYGEICSKGKLCGDCCMDLYEQDKAEEAWENFKIDREIMRRRGFD